MDTSMISRLKELEAENTRLKKMYADERLKAMIVQEAFIHQIKVAMRSDRTNEIFHDETKFFNDIGHAELIERTEFSSYQVGYDSNVIISTLSTLGFELLGVGKKVLFCGMTASNDNFTEKQGIDYIMHKLPDIVLLNSLSQLELNDKITSLINMSNEE